MSGRVEMSMAAVDEMIKDLDDLEHKLAAANKCIRALTGKPVSCQMNPECVASDRVPTGLSEIALRLLNDSESAHRLRSDLDKADELLAREIAKANAFKHEREEANQRAAASEIKAIEATARAEKAIIELGNRLNRARAVIVQLEQDKDNAKVNFSKVEAILVSEIKKVGKLEGDPQLAKRERDAAFWCMTHSGMDTGCAGCPAETDGEICGKVPVVAHPKGNEVKELNARLEFVEQRLIEEQNYRVRVVDELQVRINELEKDRVEERRDHLTDHNRVADLTRVEDRRCEDNELMHIELDKLGAPRRGMNDVVYTPLGRIRAYSETTIPRIVPSESSPNDASAARDAIDALGKALQDVLTMSTHPLCKCGEVADGSVNGV